MNLLHAFFSLLIIALMVGCSKFLRQYAVGRPDSLALDVAICSFLFNLILAIKNSPDLLFFLRHELLRCIVLFAFAFVISYLHKRNKKELMVQIAGTVSEIKAAGDYQGTESAREEVGQRKRIMEATILDHLEVLARSAIDVWYSQFADAMFKKPLQKMSGKKKRSPDGTATEENDLQKRRNQTFKKEKRKVRSAFVDIVNSLPTVNERMRRAKYSDEDFNIGNRKQIVSMIVFDVMEVLAVLVAIRIIG